MVCVEPDTSVVLAPCLLKAFFPRKLNPQIRGNGKSNEKNRKRHTKRERISISWFV